MKSGIIKLIYKGKVNNQLSYNCISRQRTIIENWKKTYLGKFGEFAIQIRPDIKDQR